MLGAEQFARIAAVKAHAAANVIPFVRIYRMAHGLDAPYFTPDFMAEIPCGFRVIYGIEEQERGLIRHLSVSVTGQDHWPNPVAVEALLAAFGMPSLADSLCVWSEPLMGKERRNIVNVAAPVPTPDSQGSPIQRNP